MNDAQLLRYSRHLLLDEIGFEGQQRLSASAALVIGCGGLGSPAALYLAAAGVGQITLCDHDIVDLSNLQRQIMHTSARLGMNKAESGRKTLLALNPETTIHTVAQRLDMQTLPDLVCRHTLVLDCSDNFTTRYAVNRCCVGEGVPLVSGAAIRFSGQVAVFDLCDPHSACYECLFREEEYSDAPHCAESGVFAPLTGIVGCLQAAQAIKLLTGLDAQNNVLLTVDSRSMRFRRIHFERDVGCAVCGGHG